MHKPYQPLTTLSTVRKGSNFSQEDLAEAVGTSQRFISQIERSLSAPDVYMALKMSEVLGVSIGDLFSIVNAEERVSDHK